MLCLSSRLFFFNYGENHSTPSHNQANLIIKTVNIPHAKHVPQAITNETHNTLSCNVGEIFDKVTSPNHIHFFAENEQNANATTRTFTKEILL